MGTSQFVVFGTNESEMTFILHKLLVALAVTMTLNPGVVHARLYRQIMRAQSQPCESDPCNSRWNMTHKIVVCPYCAFPGASRQIIYHISIYLQVSIKMHLTSLMNGHGPCISSSYHTTSFPTECSMSFTSCDQFLLVVHGHVFEILVHDVSVSISWSRHNLGPILHDLNFTGQDERILTQLATHCCIRRGDFNNTRIRLHHLLRIV